MRTLVVRDGEDVRAHYRDKKTGEIHYCDTLIPVYSEMLAQCMRDYPGLPDFRTLTMTEIRWCYEWLRSGLREATKPKQPPKSPRKR